MLAPENFTNYSPLKSTIWLLTSLNIRFVWGNLCLPGRQPHTKSKPKQCPELSADLQFLCGQLNAWLGVNRCEHFKILKKTKKGQCFRLFSTLKNIKICLIWRMFTFFRNVNIRQIKQIFIFFNVENSRKHCPFFKILKCSHLFTPSHAFSWPHKIEDLCLVQVIILALILCGIVAMEYGWLEMVRRYKRMIIYISIYIEKCQ